MVEPCFRPIYQFLFAVLHLFREAWLQKFVDFGNDVSLIKFGDVIRLIDRNRDELTEGELLRIMIRGSSRPVAPAQLGDTGRTQTTSRRALAPVAGGARTFVLPYL
jgi:hypothetical protein